MALPLLDPLPRPGPEMLGLLEMPGPRLADSSRTGLKTRAGRTRNSRAGRRVVLRAASLRVPAIRALLTRISGLPGQATPVLALQALTIAWPPMRVRLDLGRAIRERRLLGI